MPHPYFKLHSDTIFDQNETNTQMKNRNSFPIFKNYIHIGYKQNIFRGFKNMNIPFDKPRIVSSKNCKLSIMQTLF